MCETFTCNEKIFIIAFFILFFGFMTFLMYRENKKAQEINRKFSLQFIKSEVKKRKQLKENMK